MFAPPMVSSTNASERVSDSSVVVVVVVLFTRCSVPIQPHMSTRRSLSPPEGEPGSKRQDVDADSTNSSEPILEVVESDESPPPSPVESSRQQRDQPSTPGSSKSGISNSVSVYVGGVGTTCSCVWEGWAPHVYVCVGGVGTTCLCVCGRGGHHMSMCVRMYL